jgi:hypothetical protein
VQDQDEWVFIDKNGKAAFPGRYEDAKPFSEGLAPVRVGCCLWGYLNTQGELAIAPQFEEAGSFHQGFAEVVYQGKTQRIDKNGHFVTSSPTKQE